MKNKILKIRYHILLSMCLVFVNNISSNIIEKLNVPENFDVQIFAQDIDSPRQMTQTKNGYIVVGSKKGNEIVDGK